VPEEKTQRYSTFVRPAFRTDLLDGVGRGFALALVAALAVLAAAVLDATTDVLTLVALPAAALVEAAPAADALAVVALLPELPQAASKALAPQAPSMPARS